MLHIRKVLGAKPKEHVKTKLRPLLTPWGETLDPDHVLEEHPNPQFAREAFHMLNGQWDCTFVANGHDPTGDLLLIVTQASMPADEAFDQSITVPFSPEATLSGVGRQLRPDELLWYRRPFTVPAHLKGAGALLLRFQAVDHTCAVRVNGQLVGMHVGGYLPFAFDIAPFLEEGVNELAVCVADPSEFGAHLRGKQRIDRGDIWYTAQSGIWQPVWLESAPIAHITYLRIEPDAQTGVIAVGARLKHFGNDMPATFRMEVLDASKEVVASADCLVDSPTCAVAAAVPDVRRWSPDDPYLYHLRFTYGEDTIASYCGFRTVETRVAVDGHARVFLNGEPLFIEGVLDQAHWPDGLMTAPSDAALAHDIAAMRDVGFNLMRKHVKVEAARWYYHCDRMGMLVLQDMVSGGDKPIRPWQWSYKPTLFKASWSRYSDRLISHQRQLGSGDATFRDEWVDSCRQTVESLGNHPCIIGWSLFNEGWGQFDARAATQMTREADPSRVIDATSGWYDQGCGDFFSVHNYFRDQRVWPDRRKRAFLVSEFGGYVHHVENHSSLPDAYGYETYTDATAWRSAYNNAIADIRSLQRDGLAGYVYTQVSDIEEETNGILTFDRRVNKLQLN